MVISKPIKAAGLADHFLADHFNEYPGIAGANLKSRRKTTINA
jgi:hypothetical protein